MAEFPSFDPEALKKVEAKKRRKELVKRGWRAAYGHGVGNVKRPLSEELGSIAKRSQSEEREFQERKLQGERLAERIHKLGYSKTAEAYELVSGGEPGQAVVAEYMKKYEGDPHMMTPAFKGFGSLQGDRGDSATPKYVVLVSFKNDKAKGEPVNSKYIQTKISELGLRGLDARDLVRFELQHSLFRDGYFVGLGEYREKEDTARRFPANEGFPASLFESGFDILNPKLAAFSDCVFPCVEK